MLYNLKARYSFSELAAPPYGAESAVGIQFFDREVRAEECAKLLLTPA